MQNSSSEKVSALVSNNSFQYSEFQNQYTEAALVDSKFLDDHGITSYPPTDSSSGTKFSTNKSDQRVQSRAYISNESTELDDGQYRSIVVQDSKIGDSSTSFDRDVHCDVTLESGMEALSDNNGSPCPPSHHKNVEVQYDGSEGSIDDTLTGQESMAAENSSSNETLNSSLEFPSTNIVAGEDVSTGTVGCFKKPFQLLMNMPRFDDEELRGHIRFAKLHVDEKTRIRDAILQEIKKKKENCQYYRAEYEAAKSEERSTRKQIMSKRVEIGHLQTEISRAKNAIFIEQIDARICSMELMIQHETIPLKEETFLKREIKQMKQLRNQLSTSTGSSAEVQKALDNLSQFEEDLKVLKKERDSLKKKASKDEADVLAVSLRYKEESKMHRELKARYKAANESCQAAYEELQVLKKELDSLKNKASKDEAVVSAVSLRYEEESRQAAYEELQVLRKTLHEKEKALHQKEEEPMKLNVDVKEDLKVEKNEDEEREVERQREKSRLEEMMKAKEALERKKRHAEKAQARAELRAQKEAEQREKEKEKRLRKKERKKSSVGEAGNEIENGLVFEPTKETIGERGRKSQKASPQCAKQNKAKSIPPPLRNKSKRRLQQWLRVILTSFAVIILFLLGNISFFASLKQRQNAL